MKTHALIPPGCGIGLKPCHYDEILHAKPPLSFLEIHPENYMVEGGLQLYYLEQIRQHYAISMHGVGMSLGSAEGVNDTHLKQLAQLVKAFAPALVSEHLSWSHGQGVYFNDLLPLPYTREALQHIENNIHRVQDALQRSILIENPSTYLEFPNDELSEQQFLASLCKKTGCQLLLDINNVFVSSSNHGRSPSAYLESYPFEHVAEIHLAGHSIHPLIADQTIRIDDHGSAVSEEVWQLFSQFAGRCRTPPATLIEWDTNTPELDILLQQASRAHGILNKGLNKPGDLIC